MLNDTLNAIEGKIKKLLLKNAELQEQNKALSDNKVLLEKKVGSFERKITDLENQLRAAHAHQKSIEVDDKSLREIKNQLQSYIVYLDDCIEKLSNEKVAS
jgi:chromosome segregation ATPase